MSELPKAPAARIIKNAGATRVGEDAVEFFLATIEDYGTSLAIKANNLARHAGRKTVKASDIKLAMQD